MPRPQALRASMAGRIFIFGHLRRAAELGAPAGGGDAAATITNRPHHNAKSAGAITR